MIKNEFCGFVVCCFIFGIGVVFLSSCWEVFIVVSGLLSFRIGKLGRLKVLLVIICLGISFRVFKFCLGIYYILKYFIG